MDNDQLSTKLGLASKRADGSLEQAKDLLDNGQPGPALVWAVRSVEIFLKEFVLVASFVGDRATDWDKAVRKASNLFERLSWRKALTEIDNRFGPLDEMVTEDGRNALHVWEKEIVPARHNIVHGREDASMDHAAWVIGYAAQIIMQLKLRLVVAQKHLFSDVFINMIQEAQARYHGRSPNSDDPPTENGEEPKK